MTDPAAVPPTPPTGPAPAAPASYTPTGYPPPAATGYAAPAPAPRKPGNGLALASVITGAALFVLYLIVKVLPVTFYISNNNTGNYDATDAGAMFFGVLGLLAVIPAALVVVLGHLALRKRADGSTPGRALAGAGLALGYALLLMWGNRILLAVVEMVGYGSGPDYFVPAIFWWT